MTIDLMDIKTIRKINALSTRVLDLMNDKDELTQSDLQGCIDAIIMDAMQYGKEAK